MQFNPPYVINFISSFIDTHLKEEIPKINNSIKNLAYSQAALDVAIIVNNGSAKNHEMAIFTFLFPLFTALGISIGLFTGGNSKDGKITTISLLTFIIISAVHALFLFVYFFMISWISAIAFLFSIIVAVNIIGYAVQMHHSAKALKDTSDGL